MTHAGPLPRAAATLGLPPGAIAAPDGTVTLTLRRPVTLPLDPAGGWGRGSRVCGELRFGRLSGAVMRRGITKSEKGKGLAAANFAASRCLDMTPSVFAVLRAGAGRDDREAISAVMQWLLGDEGVPDRAVKQPDGSFVLPLLYPVPDGGGARQSLHLVPLSREEARSLPASKVKRAPICLERATGIPLEQAKTLMDAMDAADLTAVAWIIDPLEAETSERVARSAIVA